MKIGIDCRKINDSGNGTYISKIIENFGKMLPINTFYLFVPPNFKNNFSFHPNIKVVEIKQAPYSLWDQFIWPRILKKYKIDVLHCPYPWIPLFWLGRIVVTVHDMIPFIIKEIDENLFKRWYSQLMTCLAVYRASKVITVSENTENDILCYFKKLNPAKLSIIYNGIDKEEFNRHISQSELEAIREKYNICKKIILFSGRWKQHKGLELLLKTFSYIKKEGLLQDYCLVITGKQNKKYKKITDLINKVQNPKDIILTDYISYEEILTLYKTAEIVAIPSKYEGFGLIYLEALLAGAKLVAYNNKLTEELGIPKNYTFRSYEMQSLRECILSVIEQDKIELPDFSKFSWEACAKATLSVYLEQK